jgi:lysophospholipase L1-like esterase
MNRRKFFKNCAVTAGTLGLGAGTHGRDLPVRPDRVGGHDYRLPSFRPGSRLVFQGDSITDMKWGRNEQDRNHYLGHSFVFLLAARLGVELPEARLDFYNRGVSGNTVADLRKRWDTDVIAMKPDVLTILVGANDVGQGVPPAAYAADYCHLLEASRAANPELRLVLLDPFVLPSGSLADQSAWTTSRTATDKLGEVVARLAADFDAVHVRLQEVFTTAAREASAEYWIWDGVHPLPQGHELIARHWLKEVSARWPKA